jgi:hypothetical protein
VCPSFTHQLHVGLVPAAPELGVGGGLSTALACPLFALHFPFFLFFPLPTAFTPSSSMLNSSPTSLIYFHLECSDAGFGFAWLTSLICVNFFLKLSVEIHSPATLAASVRISGLVKPWRTISNVITFVIVRLHSYLAASCCSCSNSLVRALIASFSAVVHGVALLWRRTLLVPLGISQCGRSTSVRLFL